MWEKHKRDAASKKISAMQSVFSGRMARRSLTLTLALTLVLAALPATVLAEEGMGTQKNEPKLQTEGRPAVHDYGKSGDDPATEADESAIVANEDLFKSNQYQASTKYTLKANGTPVSVYKYQKQENPGKYYHMDVARFSSDDAEPIFEVALNDGTEIDSVIVYPERYYPQDSFQISGDKRTLTFQMSEALRYCIVNINGTENDREGKPQLAIINDPTETGQPDVDGANVLNFKTFSDSYLAQHPITDTVGEKCREGGSVTDTSLNTSDEYTWEYGEGVYQDYWDRNVYFPNKRARLKNDVSDAFQAALQEVKESDTLDTIYFPAGTYVWSGLSIKDWDGNGEDGALNIYVDEDALLVNRMQECVEAMEPAIGIWNSSNITVSGRGIFDGNGTYSKNRDSADAGKSCHQGGCMVVQSQNITFNDTYLRDAKQWNWECHTGEDITYNNIKGLSPFQHSWVDGLDLTSGKNITVNGAITMGNDDTFASGHYNPSNGFPQSGLSGADLTSPTEEQKHTAAAAAIYNKERLEWDTKDSENFKINNTLGWSTFANAIRLGHNTRWKADGGSYQMKSYMFNNVNTLHVQGWNPNLGGGALSIQNGTNHCNPNYESLVFNNCSFTATAGGNSAKFPKDSNLDNFNPDKVILKNCWFKDAETPVSFRKIKSVRVEDLYLGGELVKVSSQVDLNVGDDVGSFVFLADGEPVADNELPVITSLRDTVQAYAENPLVFYVRAKDPDGDEVIIQEADVSDLKGASFDNETGEFKWTPSAEDIGKLYSVKFSVTDHTGTPVSKTVKIQVSSSQNVPQRYLVSEDAHMQSWKGEKAQNFGGTRYLTAVKNSKYGQMNENLTTTSTSDANDAKIIYLKFDLSEIKKQKGLYSKAELAMTYIIKRNNNKGDIEDGIKVAVVDNSDWKEGEITWNTKPSFDVENAVESMIPFRLGTEVQDKPSGDNQAINGGRAVADISKFVEDAIDNGQDYLSLAVCETQEAEVYFVSREGAEGFKNATADMAPSVLLYIPTPVDVEGPEGMTLKEGYQAAKTDSFAVKGEGSLQVTFTCENCDNKITWNDETRQIEIAEGLTVGSYTASIQATNSDNGSSKTVNFTLTVQVDKSGLQNVYDRNSRKKESEYKKATWTGFQAALEAAKAVLDKENAGQTEIDQAQKALQNAARALVKRPVASGLRQTYEKYADRNEKKYTAASWTAFANALKDAEDILGSLEDETSTQKEIDDAQEALEASARNLVEKDQVQIAGPASMALTEGYEAAVSESFAISGGEQTAVSLGGDTAAGKITWDAEANKLKIAAGIPVGEYVVIVKVQEDGDEENAAECTFTLSVAKAPIEKEISISGPDHMLLEAGYEAAVTDSYKITGCTDPVVTLSGDTADGKISWDSAAKALKIAEGIAAGEYAVKLQVQDKQDAGRTAECEFKLIVTERTHATEEDKKALEDVYNSNKDKAKAEYTSDTWKAYEDALQAVQDVLGKSDATLLEVRNAQKKLEDAVKALVKKATTEEKNALRSICDAHREKKESGYTAETWKTFADALKAADSVLANADATAQEVEEAKKALESAVSALKTKSASDPGTNIQPQPPKEIKMSGLSFAAKSYKIAAGRKLTLTPKITPSNTTNKKLEWTTSDKKYATVSNKGVVMTKKAGAGKTVTITVKAKDGSKKQAKVKIKLMKNAVVKITLKANSKTLKAGKKMTVKAVVKANGKKANKALEWTCSNSKYATVSNKGVIKAKKAGAGKSVTITARSTDGTNKKASLKVRIKK